MYGLSWSMLLYVWVVLLLSLVKTQRIILRSGRHVCQQHKTVMVPVPRTRSVCTPFYQRSYRPCPQPRSGLCPTVRLMYRTDFRRVIVMVPRTQTFLTCCPGWTGYDVTYGTCRKPVCKPECHHGGDCLLPNRCRCPDGWNGSSCQSDVDECKNSPCDQKCVNTGGSFRCECYQGYRLAQDGHTCTLCLSCTDEFTNILQDQKQLRRTIVKLEEHNTIMMKNLTVLHKDLQTLTTMPRVTTPPMTTPSITTPSEKEGTAEDLSEELDAYMSSISEQIAMLEERLDVCTCKEQTVSRARTVRLSPRLNPNIRRFGNSGHYRVRPHTTSTTPKPVTATKTTKTDNTFLLVRLPSK